jgi:hypothetical protein
MTPTPLNSSLVGVAVMQVNEPKLTDSDDIELSGASEDAGGGSQSTPPLQVIR